MRSLEELEQFREQLTVNPTPAERQLRHKLTQMREDFRFQEIIGFYIVDFLLPKHCLIIEVDGSIHNEAEQKRHDIHRAAFLQSCGFTLLRLTNGQVKTFNKSRLRSVIQKAVNTDHAAFDRAWQTAQRARENEQAWKVDTDDSAHLLSESATIASLQSALSQWAQTACFAGDAEFARRLMRQLTERAATVIRERASRVEKQECRVALREERKEAMRLAEERATKVRLIKRNDVETTSALEYAISKP